MIRKNPRRSLVLLSLIAVCCAVLPSCEVAKVRSDAHRSMFDAVAPEYARYVEADDSLTEQQRVRRLRTVDTWRILVADGEVNR